MAIASYRRMRAEEQAAVVRLWSEVFELPEAQQAERLTADPAAQEHTYVAVGPDGALLSALHTLLTRRRDADGRPRLVGEIDSVATRPAMRRQGHAERLLLLALAELERAGCDWSLLVTTEMGRPLYQRHGWRPFPEPWRRGTVVGAPPAQAAAYRVEPLDPQAEPDAWARIAAVDVAFNQGRPLMVVRDVDYWRGYAARRVNGWIADEGLVILAAVRPDETALCGYAMVEFYPSAFQIRDLAVLPSEPDALPALLHAAGQESQRRGAPPAARLFLPREPWIDAAVERLFGATLQHGQTAGGLMARAGGPRFSEAQLDALFAAEGAIFSSIDLF
ncbi:MAG TPA: GNAT family N-acetyltransferase [Roseiflexaceae bacterium]|nr:GNAT family N-acetyltransferase [Roseiflexaceae bacterium]